MAVEKKIQELVNYCRKNGISSLKQTKSGDLDITFFPAAAFPEKKSKEKQDAVPSEEMRELTEEEILEWSVPSIPGEATN